MKAFSMFSGIGGFELGIQMASEDIELIGYSEIDKYAIQVYEKHFSGATNYGNATTIDGEQLPDFDLLVGGFPCQAFSVAGKREGFNETRGTLFFDIARILSDKRPRYLVLENVKGLLSHDEGKTFQTILRVLADLGYGVEWQVLNSKDYSVPQNRERVFIVGHFGNRSPRKVFPITENVRETSIVTGKDISYSLDANYYKGTNTLDKNRRQLVATPVLTPELNEITKAKSQGSRVYDSNGLSASLKSEGGGWEAKTGLYKNGLRIRRLTPTECERLQGFPDGWTEGLSDTQRYKTLGNAVTTTVVKAVMERLLGGIVDTKIYTDGSCLGNPGVGGWGAVIICPDGREEELSGGEEATTNNRMEIQAIIKALSELLPGTSVEVLSDSEYVVNTMTKGWKKKLNTDLWYELNNVISRLGDIKWTWVKAHDGNHYNEQADCLAKAAAESMRETV